MSDVEKRNERTITRNVDVQLHFRIITCVGCGAEAPQPAVVSAGMISHGELWPDLTGWHVVRQATAIAVDKHACPKCFPRELASKVDFATITR